LVIVYGFVDGDYLNCGVRLQTESKSDFEKDGLMA